MSGTMIRSEVSFLRYFYAQRLPTFDASFDELVAVGWSHGLPEMSPNTID